MKPRTWKLTLWVVLAVGALAQGCGAVGSGSCVGHTSGTSSSWDYCCDGQKEADCTPNNSSTTTTFHPSTSCSSMGYTLTCSSDSRGCFRLPAYAPCP